MTTVMNISIFGLLALTFISCGQTSSTRPNNQHTIPAQKDTCDDPDAHIKCCFVNMPAKLTNIMAIAQANEPGEKLVITGTIFKSDGITPHPNVILYAYQTDNTGHYSKKGNETGFQKWHGHLHGWCKTDSNGYYEIHSVRPARYPDNSMPAHIHMAIKTDSGQMFYINDFVFKDDSLVNAKYLSSLDDVGGSGVVDLNKNSENIWRGKRNIVIK
jgi:protocatechuate 3,4-dioxygenase, beta subunit